jgi:glycosyltransferase involved in cell wall biosynthesis
MRILVVSHNYPRFPSDPAGNYVRLLAQGFGARGHAVLVLAPHTPGTATREAVGTVSVLRFRYGPERLERVGYRGESRMGRLLSGPAGLMLPAYLLAFRRAIAQSVRQFAPDVIHAHWWLPAGWLAAGEQLPLVVTSHGSDVRLLEQVWGLTLLAERLVRPGVTWTAASQFLAADLERSLSLPAGTVLPIPMPIEITEFEQGREVRKDAPPRILYAGNLLPSKGVDILIEAFGLLRARGLEARLRILGEGPARPRQAALIADRGLEESVSLHPFVPQSAMPTEFGASTVTVLPSRGQAEGLGLVLAEALLAGSAVIGSRVGGIPEVVHHDVTGLLVPDGDPAALADALGRLIGDPQLRRRLTAAGRSLVRDTFGPDRAAERFLSLFADVRQRHGLH